MVFTYTYSILAIACSLGRRGRQMQPQNATTQGGCPYLSKHFSEIHTSHLPPTVHTTTLQPPTYSLVLLVLVLHPKTTTLQPFTVFGRKWRHTYQLELSVSATLTLWLFFTKYKKIKIPIHVFIQYSMLCKKNLLDGSSI